MPRQLGFSDAVLALSLWGLDMKRLFKLGLTAATLALMATSANAAVTLDGSTPYDAALASGQTSVVNFDTPNAAGYTFQGKLLRHALVRLEQNQKTESSS